MFTLKDLELLYDLLSTERPSEEEYELASKIYSLKKEKEKEKVAEDIQFKGEVLTYEDYRGDVWFDVLGRNNNLTDFISEFNHKQVKVTVELIEEEGK